MTAASFPRRHRLLTAADYSRAFRDAKRSSDRYFTVLTYPNGLGHARLGLAVSKKTDKRAVVRNFIKRQIRESFRTESKAPADFVVVSRPAAAGQTGPALRHSLSNHWRRLSREPAADRHG